MKTTKTKVKIEEDFSFFTERQIEAIKMILKEGAWGDAGQKFGDGKNYIAYGYCTNLNKGKEWSGILSGISKKIESSGTNLIVMHPDYWGDDSGDMMFFNMELIDELELSSWAGN